MIAAACPCKSDAVFPLRASSCTPRLVVRPVLSSRSDIDVTDAVVATIARELWNRFGGNEVVNWLEAEAILQDALAAVGTTDAATQ